MLLDILLLALFGLFLGETFFGLFLGDFLGETFFGLFLLGLLFGETFLATLTGLGLVLPILLLLFSF